MGDSELKACPIIIKLPRTLEEVLEKTLAKFHNYWKILDDVVFIGDFQNQVSKSRPYYPIR